jgi:hypothetical protein
MGEERWCVGGERVTERSPCCALYGLGFGAARPAPGWHVATFARSSSAPTAPCHRKQGLFPLLCLTDHWPDFEGGTWPKVGPTSEGHCCCPPPGCPVVSQSHAASTAASHTRSTKHHRRPLTAAALQRAHVARSSEPAATSSSPAPAPPSAAGAGGAHSRACTPRRAAPAARSWRGTPSGGPLNDCSGGRRPPQPSMALCVQ